MNNCAPPGTPGAPGTRLITYYLSRDRILTLADTARLLPQILHALQNKDAPTTAAVLGGTVSRFVLSAIASGSIKTLQQLAIENELRAGNLFIYNGHFYGKGFGVSNKGSALSLTEKLGEPIAPMNLVLEFSKNGLVNNTAYTRMAGSTRLFAFAYIADITADVIRAIPYAIGDLVHYQAQIPLPFSPTLELRPNDIDQFSGMDETWIPSKTEFARLADISEHEVKTLICGLLGEHEVPNDWGGEEGDLFSGRILVDGERKTGAFLLKGPAKFHPMTLRDLGKNADQIYRLFNIPAQVYVIQHCHDVGAAVRKTVEAYALHRSFTAPCHFIIMDGVATAQLLRAHGLWRTATPARRVKKPDRPIRRTNRN